MVNRQLRSTSVRKIERKSPGGRSITIYKNKRTGLHHCGRCGSNLNMPHDTLKIRKLSKSEKIPSRAYPMLCNNCAEELERYKAGFNAKFKLNFNADFTRDLTLERFLPVGWLNNLSGKNKTIKAKQNL